MMQIRERPGRAARARNQFLFGAKAPSGGAAADDIVSFGVYLQTSLVPWVAFGSYTPTFSRASTAYVLGYDAGAVIADGPVQILCASGEARFMGARRVSEGVWSGVDANGVALTTTNGASALCCDASGPFGYLAEGARTDVLGVTTAIRRTMADVGWVSGGGGITVGAATGADGVASAGASLTATGANGTILFTTVLGAAIRTFSAWVRRKTGTGTVNITGDNGGTWTAMTLTTTYQLFQFTTASAANPVVGFRVVTDTDAIEVDFNTLEAATFANPTPIPVNVSKAADLLTYVSAGNASGVIGSAYAEIVSATPTTGVGVLSTYSGGVQGEMLGVSTNVTLYDVTAVRTFTGATVSANTMTKVATSWGNSASAGYANGTVGTARAFDDNLNLAINMAVGGQISAGAELYGNIRDVRIYQQALSASRLQALTT